MLDSLHQMPIREPLPPLWQHQRDAILWAARRLVARDPDGSGALLAMDMGTGKTRCGIELLAWQARHLGRAFAGLIIAPKAVVPVWAEQIAQFWPDPYMEMPAVVTHAGGSNSKRSAARIAQLESAEIPHIVIVNYETFARDKNALRLASEAGAWAIIIADEAHRLKAPKGVTSRAIWHLAEASGHTHRIGLTGTPLPHRHTDAFGLMRFIDPSIFGVVETRFRSRYLKRVLPQEARTYPMAQITVRRGGEYDHWIPDNMGEFEEKMAVATFRVDAADVLDLPPATDQTMVVEMGAKGAQAYADMENHFVSQVGAGVVTAVNAGVLIMRLQQIASGRVTEEHVDTEGRPAPRRAIWDHAKQNALTSLLADASGEPIVVFCRFLTDIDSVGDACKSDNGRPFFRLFGGANEMNDWKQSPDGVLAVQFQAGGVGVDLSHARIAVWYTLPHSLGLYDQARARLVRPGQTRPVTFVALLARRTKRRKPGLHPAIDDEVHRALLARREIIGAVIDGFKTRTKERTA